MGDLCLICKSGPCQNTGREWRSGREVEMKPELLSECRVDLRFWTLRRMIRLRLDVSEIRESDGQSWHFKPSSGSVALLWKELCKCLYVSLCGWKGRGLLLWNWVVNSRCLSADYSGMGLGLQAWENPLLSKVIQLWAQLLSNNYCIQSRRVSRLKTSHNALTNPHW